MPLYTVTNRTAGPLTPPEPFSQKFRKGESRQIAAPAGAAENPAVQKEIRAGTITVSAANDPNTDDALEGTVVDTVASAGIPDDSITNAKMADDSIDSAELVDRSVGIDPIDAQDPNDNAPLLSIIQNVPAGAGGSADDVAVAVSYSSTYKICDVQFLCTTAVGGSTVQLRTGPAGGGSPLSSVLDTASTGRKQDDGDLGAPTNSLPGVFLRRSDSGIAGDLVIYFRKQT